MTNLYTVRAMPLDAMLWPWFSAKHDSIGRPLSEPMMFLIGNAKARRRWRRRNIPNSQKKFNPFE